MAYAKGILFTTVIPIALSLTFCLILYYIYKIRLKDIRCDYDKKTKQLEDSCNKKIQKIISDYNLKLTALNKREEIIKSLIKSGTPFKYVAEMAADLLTYLYEKDENYLRYKPHPAISSAEKLRQLRESFKEKMSIYKEYEYKLLYIIKLFPEINEYLNNDYELLKISEYISYSDFQDNRDKSKDFLSDAEWNTLTIQQRNQLALNRYIQKRKKSNWAIGRDYEMSCAHSLREKGFNVEMNGIEKKYGDLGRDLIATKFDNSIFGDYDTKGKIFIIQCKCWNKDLPIPESVLMQLYGTTIAYKIENKSIISDGVEIIPILMIPSFTRLSEMAKNFAKMLQIKILVQDFVEFPRIKCNINNGHKIYHLPFDQQYDNAQIKNKGEFYAYSVEEAESKGFRRAMKHSFN
ncbi:restriction endonuclease [Barnesiella sp. An55]|uniref:restriction endonuclease n=1 Tax=Barnesiella sp. An55 TaxID=1965646 RepID=UPI000B371678|nr:restriction endonuclease [Barnesiella sp. An55]OUN68712.1 hypothetical protein B5G10_12215 [Barnesiella sp. An55]